MARTKAAELIKAADKFRRADRRVIDAQRALTFAVRARDKAETTYLQLVRASIDCKPADSGKEGNTNQAAA